MVDPNPNPNPNQELMVDPVFTSDGHTYERHKAHELGLGRG